MNARSEDCEISNRWRLKSERAANLGIEFSVEEVVIRITSTERMSEERRRRRTVGRITEVYLSVNESSTGCLTNKTHIVKQSYMKPTASGLMVPETSSGIGGASFRLPSL